MQIKNPIDSGWYADPEARFYNGRYYIYVTQSFSDFESQLNIDMFVSDNLQTWKKITNVICMKDFPWAKKAIWAPTIVELKGKYYLIFASNDIHEDYEGGGLEIAVADSPEGPFRGYLGKPLIGNIVNGAQPIDAHLFKDDDGKVYLYYGGWGHCNMAVMNENMTGFVPFEDGSIFKEITPEDYVEGPCMIKEFGKYYFLWSSGGWTQANYHVNYAVSDSPFGKFEIMGTILEKEEGIANGPGHCGYLKIDGSDEYLLVYHRRPLEAQERGCRVLCIDRLRIKDSRIEPVKMTNVCNISIK